MNAERATKIVRTVFFLKSAIGWIIFLVGFGKLLYSIKVRSSSDEIGFSKSVSQALTGPMWLFLVSSTLLYVTYSLQIFKSSENIGHILHCIVVFFNLFFTSGGVLSITIGILYEGQSTLRGFLEPSLPDPMAMKMILIGTTISLITFWIGLGVWPLLSIRRQRYRGYTELQESSRIVN